MTEWSLGCSPFYSQSPIGITGSGTIIPIIDCSYREHPKSGEGTKDQLGVRLNLFYHKRHPTVRYTSLMKDVPYPHVPVSAHIFINIRKQKT